MMGIAAQERWLWWRSHSADAATDEDLLKMVDEPAASTMLASGREGESTFHRATATTRERACYRANSLNQEEQGAIEGVRSIPHKGSEASNTLQPGK